MRLIAVSLFVLAAVIAIAMATRIVPHHTSCTYTSSGGSDYFNNGGTRGTQSCTTRTGLW